MLENRLYLEGIFSVIRFLGQLDLKHAVLEVQPVISSLKAHQRIASAAGNDRPDLYGFLFGETSVQLHSGGGQLDLGHGACHHDLQRSSDRSSVGCCPCAGIGVGALLRGIILVDDLGVDRAAGIIDVQLLRFLCGTGQRQIIQRQISLRQGHRHFVCLLCENAVKGQRFFAQDQRGQFGTDRDLVFQGDRLDPAAVLNGDHSGAALTALMEGQIQTAADKGRIREIGRHFRIGIIQNQRAAVGVILHLNRHSVILTQSGVDGAGSGAERQLGGSSRGGNGDGLGHRGVVALQADFQRRFGVQLCCRRILRVMQGHKTVRILVHIEIIGIRQRNACNDLSRGSDSQVRGAGFVEQIDLFRLLYTDGWQGIGNLDL